jgi:hypothetical protein
VRQEDIQRALAAGFHAHIGKPVRAYDLIASLVALTRRPAA